MSKHLLIAGAGYLGSEIQTQAAASHQITALTKSGDNDSTPCDLSDESQVEALAKNIPTPDTIVHCASSGRGGPEAYQAVFVHGCLNLRKHFPNSHLILTSSTSVYHQTDGSDVDENSPTEPIRETSQLLLEAEKIVITAGGTVARLAGLYGPDRSIIYRKFMDDTATIEEDGRRILNQIHIKDAASAILHLAALKTQGVYNVCDNTPMSQLTCYQKLSEHFEKPLPPVGEKNTQRKRAWTHKRVLNHKLLATNWHPNFPDFTQAVKSFI